jgi:hypothetical protein
LFDDKKSDQFADSIAQMGLFFNESLRMGHDVIMSCEHFINVPPHMILQLKAMLRGFDVTVVAVYREFISQLVSWNKFANRWMTGHALRLSKYLLEVLDGRRDEFFLKLCEDWQVLGRLVIVVYYGSIAAGNYTYCLTILRYTPIYTPIYDSQDTPYTPIYSHETSNPHLIPYPLGKSIPAVVLYEVGGVLCAETEDDSHANISDETQVG